MRKRAIMTFLSRKFMITRLSIAFEDLLGSSIASQVMPPWFGISLNIFKNWLPNHISLHMIVSIYASWIILRTAPPWWCFCLVGLISGWFHFVPCGTVAAVVIVMRWGIISGHCVIFCTPVIVLYFFTRCTVHVFVLEFFPALYLCLRLYFSF